MQAGHIKFKKSDNKIDLAGCKTVSDAFLLCLDICVSELLDSFSVVVVFIRVF